MSIDLKINKTCIRSDAASQRHLLLQIRAPEASNEVARSPASVAFVIDRSGSMAGQKLALAREAVVQAIRRLLPSDRFAVVSYDDEVTLVYESSLCTEDTRRAATERVQRIAPGGTTNLSGGWLTGCGQIAERLNEETVGRCLLLTDGLANRGITDPVELRRHAMELRNRGVSTSTFGIGADFDEGLLGCIADSGGGSFTFVDSAEKIPALIGQELGETLEVVARQVLLELTVPDGVEITGIGPYAIQKEAGVSRIKLPDLVSAQELLVPVRIVCPPGPAGQTLAVSARLSDREGRLQGAQTRVAFEFADAQTNTRQPTDWDVDRTIARYEGARAEEKALLCNQRGKYQEAARLLEEAAKSLREYGAGDDMITGLAAELEKKAVTYVRPMASAARKMAYASSTSVTRGRSIDGRKSRYR